MRPEALIIARDIKSTWYRSLALTDLVVFFPETLYEAFKNAKVIEGEDWCVNALVGLAPLLSENLLDEAFKIITAINSESIIAEALPKLAPYLSEGLLDEALEIARSIKNERFRAIALTNLAPLLSKELS